MIINAYESFELSLSCGAQADLVPEAEVAQLTALLRTLNAEAQVQSTLLNTNASFT